MDTEPDLWSSVRMAIQCASTVAHLSTDPRVVEAISAAQQCAEEHITIAPNDYNIELVYTTPYKPSEIEIRLARAWASVPEDVTTWASIKAAHAIGSRRGNLDAIARCAANAALASAAWAVSAARAARAGNIHATEGATRWADHAADCATRLEDHIRNYSEV